MDQNFIDRGFTNIFQIDAQKELANLADLIYQNTKQYLADHDSDISLNEKLNLNFKEIPSSDIWSELMATINKSEELTQLINSNGIKEGFKRIFSDPQLFKISTFRARLPDQKRVIYNWHQDEGTWFVSKNKNELNKYPATLWFSINGANKEDSIQLVKFSHKKKLYNHEFVSGQGYFNLVKKDPIKNDDITTIDVKPSECVIFHPLTIHRSVPPKRHSLRPRYTIDIRYYDEKYNFDYKTDFSFKIKKIFKQLF